MQFSRRTFVASLAGLMVGATVGMPAMAQTAGVDYNPIMPPQPTEDAGRIEVLEFFSFGCPHCAEFNPLLQAWAAKLPADVVLRKVPVTFDRAAWVSLARLYYALEVTGDHHRLEADVFKAIHQERQNLFEDRALTEWVAKKGVDAKKFADAFNSFGVRSKVARGDKMANTYTIGGVPSIAVEGKYLVV